MRLGDLVVYYDPSGSMAPVAVLLLEIAHQGGMALVMNEIGCHWISLEDIGTDEARDNESW